MVASAIANIPPQGGRKHPEQQYIQLDTTNILFICGGTFSGIEEIIKKRIGKQRIGFSGDSAGEKEKELRVLLPQLQTEDLLEYGLIPEFVGRLPTLATLDPLDEDDLVRVMMEPRNAVIRQYQKYFELEGVKLEFDEAALRAIAHKAIKRETGVRAIRALVEDFLRDLLYDLPETKDVMRYVVTEGAFLGEEPVRRVRRPDSKLKRRDSA